MRASGSWSFGLRRTAAGAVGVLGGGLLALAGPVAGAWAETVHAASPQVQSRAADAAWGCDSFGYLFQSPGGGPGTIYQVNLATGAYTDYAATADTLNGIGYNTTDNYMYGWDSTRGQLVRVGADGSLTLEGVPAGMASADVAAGFNVGDFDASGNLWLASSGGTLPWYEIDLAAGTASYGDIVAHGHETVPAAGTTLPADWSFIGGDFYGVAATSGAAAALVEFDPATGTDSVAGSLTGVPGSGGFGAAYTDAAGDLFASDNGSGAIYRINVGTLSTQLVSQGPAAGNNDGARCRTAPIPTIQLGKAATGLAQAADQFTVSITDSTGTVLTSATTPAGTAPAGGSSAVAGTTATTSPWPVTQGGTYTLSEAVAAGSPDPLAAYTSAIACQDTTTAAAVTPGGSAPSWTLPVTSTDAYQCTITNTPVPASLTVTKSANTSTVHTVGNVIEYSYLVTNTGALPLSGIAVTDTQAAPASALDAAPVCPSAALAAGASETCTASYTVTSADAKNGKITDSATAGASTQWGAAVVSQPSDYVVTFTAYPNCPCHGGLPLLPWLLCFVTELIHVAL
ncbi:MAG TPA: hypothetical protein VGX23_04900 [Actinocrinis sp.]|nr:hypothetical protein [Actinocrinis sp.]